MAWPLLHGKYQAVVVGAAAKCSQAQAGVLLEREDPLIRRHTTGLCGIDNRDKRLIGIDEHAQSAALRAYIRCLDRVVGADLALDFQRIVHGISGSAGCVPAVERQDSGVADSQASSGDGWIRRPKEAILVEGSRPAIGGRLACSTRNKAFLRR